MLYLYDIMEPILIKGIQYKNIIFFKLLVIIFFVFNICAKFIKIDVGNKIERAFVKE